MANLGALVFLFILRSFFSLIQDGTSKADVYGGTVLAVLISEEIMALALLTYRIREVIHV